MDRKKLGIIASGLALLVLMFWLTQGYDDSAQAAASANGTSTSAGGKASSSTPTTATGKTAIVTASMQQNDGNSAPAPQANQNKSFATTSQTNPKLKASPLEPRAEPYALMANSGNVNVRFSVRLTGDADPSSTVYLRQSGSESGIAMNDQGVSGDVVAGDRIHGVTVPINTSALKPDMCLSYEAVLGDTVSSPLQLCVSSLPVRAATSNIDNPVIFEDGSKAVADEILVTAQPGTKIAAIHALAASINATIVGSIPPLNLYQLKLAAPTTADNLLALVTQLNTRPEVKSASINAIGQASAAPNDPEYVNQHGLQRVRAQDAWDIGANGSGVIVAVLDTGLDRTHPDFGTAGNCQLAENDCGGAITDTVGHGTEVAGVIAAKTNNGIGVAGIAPGSKVHSIQVSTTASMTVAQVNQSFTDVASYGLASVINASFGASLGTININVGSAFGNIVTSMCTAVNSAVINSGTPVSVLVAAAGNNGVNDQFYPARCNDTTSGVQAPLARKDLLIAVAATASKVEPTCGSVGIDQRCSFSNYGAWVDIAAPGADVRLVAMGGGYTTSYGTSFASPMVAGAAAILKSCGVPLNEIESTLRTSANVTVTFPNGSSAPHLDIYRALLTRNRAPTSLSISNTGLNEFTDTSTGTEVGTLTSTDADTCDKHTYSIVGGADAALFSIGGAAQNRLILTAGVLNYASKPSYAVTLRVTDYFGATSVADLPVTVNVIPVNHAPAIAAQSFTINDNSANGTNVGTVAASDPDSGNTLGYSITSGNTNNAFSINASTGTLSVNNSTALSSTFSLVVLVTDNFGATASATVTVNVNNAPTISYQTFSINDGSSNGTPVGNVVASDPNGNAVTYSILAGNTNNAFLLDATTGGLSVNNSAAVKYATTSTFDLTVRVTDGGGLSAAATVRVNVNAPVTPPPPSGGGKPGGGGCSVMPVGANPDSSVALAVLVLLGYGVRRRLIRKRG